MRRHQMDQGVENPIERRLRGAAGVRFCAFAIKPVFDDVEILRAQIDAAKIIERMINGVEFVIVVSFAAAAEHILRPLQNPTVHLVEFEQLRTASLSGSKS